MFSPLVSRLSLSACDCLGPPGLLRFPVSPARLSAQKTLAINIAEEGWSPCFLAECQHFDKSDALWENFS